MIEAGVEAVCVRHGLPLPAERLGDPVGYGRAACIIQERVTEHVQERFEDKYADDGMLLERKTLKDTRRVTERIICYGGDVSNSIGGERHGALVAGGRGQACGTYSPGLEDAGKKEWNKKFERSEIVDEVVEVAQTRKDD